ncbi:MAG: sporulation integral membrane protein YlbJ [Bacillaceae bacterium]|nr:sporulation integral membrane protein YlbJ [Bacillaceae bacterium]
MSQKSYLLTLFLGSLSLFLVITIVIFPEEAFDSALRGLKIWWDVVFPALLPFFITSEILLGFGVVHFLGVLLEPFMRPVFNVPGSGAFVMAMGLASGYPIGAKLTARLREQELISRSEGERLVSFTNTADPLFMFGAVAVGFFHNVSLGVTFAIAHYTSSFTVGLVMRFHERQGKKTQMNTHHQRLPLLVRAFHAMHRARLKDGRSFGQLIGDAVMSSVNTLLMVGGFIIIFSVIINVLNIVGITAFLASAISIIFIPFAIPAELAQSVISGFFEITLGARDASETAASIPMVHKIAVTSAIIAWSGMSVHAQVASILSSTDIRYKPYLFARVLHAVLAGFITYLIWEPVHKYLVSHDIDVFYQQVPSFGMIEMWDRFSFLGLRALLLLLFIGVCSILIYGAGRLARKIKNPR